MPIGLPEAHLSGYLVEMAIYGCYCVVFLEHMKILFRKNVKSKSYYYLLATSLTLFALITTHAVIDFYRTMHVYTGSMSTPDAPFKILERFNTFDARFRTGVYNAITLVSDLFLVYRTYIMWNRSILISIVPFGLFLVDIAMAIWVTWSLNVAKAGDLFAMTLVGQRSKYLFVVTLAENLLCSCLIAFKIWYSQREISNFLQGNGYGLNRVSAIIIESASVYSAFLIALIICQVYGNTMYFFLLNVLSPVIGIVFSAIIVRSHTSTKQPTGTLPASTAMHFSNGRSHGSGTGVSGFTATTGTAATHFTCHTEYSTTRSRSAAAAAAAAAGDGVHINLETITQISGKSMTGDEEEEGGDIIMMNERSSVKEGEEDGRVHVLGAVV